LNVNISRFPITKIVSGGQTGADRAALDWAIERGVPHGGWCPKGRKAEDGPIDGRYQLQETGSVDYLKRTEWNIRDSDGTVIFTMRSELTGGSKRTAGFALKHRKPCLHLHSGETISQCAVRLSEFLRANNIRILNVAGSRGSKEPEVGAFVRAVLDAASNEHSQTSSQPG
jgi:hypothetical protein